jgi:hypothetical protein
MCDILWGCGRLNGLLRQALFSTMLPSSCESTMLQLFSTFHSASQSLFARACLCEHQGALTNVLLHPSDSGGCVSFFLHFGACPFTDGVSQHHISHWCGSVRTGCLAKAQCVCGCVFVCVQTGLARHAMCVGQLCTSGRNVLDMLWCVPLLLLQHFLDTNVDASGQGCGFHTCTGQML